MTQQSMFEHFRQETLASAKAHVEAHLDEGITCPCCTQLAKRYRRNLYGANCRALIALYRLVTPDNPWHYIGSFQHLDSGGGDFAKARYWALVVEKPNEDEPEKRTSGIWTLTPYGQAFVRRETQIPKYALVYDSKCQGFEGPSVDIVECLGAKFNYEELMNR